ncbi:MAG: glycosyltransferase family 4 protein [Chloroflexota bacterium]
MRIAFVAPVDASRDIKHFSGTTYHLYHALAKLADVVPVQIEPIELDTRRRVWYDLMEKVTHKRYITSLHPLILKHQTQVMYEKVRPLKVDIVFSTGQGRSAYWDFSDLPCAFFSDTVFGSKFNFYPGWNVNKIQPRQIDDLKQLQQHSFQNAHRLFLTSEFALEQAEHYLGVSYPREKTVVTLIGANFMAAAPIPSEHTHEVVRLLWVGVDWKRKGGEDAFQVLQALLARGLKVELDVVGLVPPVQHEKVIAHGFLSKSNPEEYAKLQRLYANGDFFLFPSRADLTPAALAEAAAMGLAIVTTRTGGIPEMFEDGSAILLDGQVFVQEAADSIAQLVGSDALRSLKTRAYERYQQKLNWDVIAAKIIASL